MRPVAVVKRMNFISKKSFVEIYPWFLQRVF